MSGKRESRFVFKSYRIGRVFGTEIQLHSTLVMILVGYGLHSFYSGGPEKAAHEVQFLLIGFLSVLIHEYGHVFAARLYGVECRTITMHALGGLAHLETEPRSPVARLVIALAGPLTSLLLAGLAFAAIRPDGGDVDTDSPVFAFLVVNLVIAVFNMVPAYPLDGGRVLHAVLQMIAGGRIADMVSSVMAQLLSLGMVGAGLYVGSVNLVLIGAIVFFVAPLSLGNEWIWNVRRRWRRNDGNEDVRDDGRLLP